MEVHRRKDSPYWVVDLIDPLTGKRDRKSTRETTKAKAKVRAAEMLIERHEAAALARRSKPVITLGAALESYLAALQSAGKAWAKEAPRLRDRLLGLRAPFAGRHHLEAMMPFHELSERDLQGLVDARRREGLSPQSIKHELSLLRAAWHHAKAMSFEVPGIADWRIPRVRMKTRYLSWHEWERVFAALDPEREIAWERASQSVSYPQRAEYIDYRRGGRAVTVERVAKPVSFDRGATAARYQPSSTIQADRREAQDILVALTMTGGRWAEVAKLTWDQIDTATWSTVRLYGFKTSKERLVGLSGQFAAVLARRFAARDQASPYVFPGRGGLPRRECRLIPRAMDEAGCNRPDIVERHGRATIHSLRHTYASWLIQNGADISEVASVLGHSNVVMTQRYAHLGKAATAAKLAGILDQMWVGTAPKGA